MGITELNVLRCNRGIQKQYGGSNALVGYFFGNRVCGASPAFAVGRNVYSNTSGLLNACALVMLGGSGVIRNETPEIVFLAKIKGYMEISVFGIFGMLCIKRHKRFVGICCVFGTENTVGHRSAVFIGVFFHAVACK